MNNRLFVYGSLRRLGGAFERLLATSTRGYTAIVAGLVRRAALSLVAFAGICAALYLGFANVPAGLAARDPLFGVRVAENRQGDAVYAGRR